MHWKLPCVKPRKHNRNNGINCVPRPGGVFCLAIASCDRLSLFTFTVLIVFIIKSFILRSAFLSLPKEFEYPDNDSRVF